MLFLRTIILLNVFKIKTLKISYFNLLQNLTEYLSINLRITVRKATTYLNYLITF